MSPKHDVFILSSITKRGKIFFNKLSVILEKTSEVISGALCSCRTTT